MVTSIPENKTAADPSHLLRWQLQTFGLLWAAYAAYYLCRMNFAVAQPLILKEFPDWSAARVGLIPSVYATCYAIGQFINGQLGEKFGARKMMTGAMAIALLSNLAFAFTSSYPVMLLLWGLNGYAQSAGWSLVVKTLTNWTTAKRRGLFIGLISTCYQVGNVVSWLLAGWLCDAFMDWRPAFWIPALIMIPITTLFAIALRNSPEDAGFPAVRDDLGDLPSSKKGDASGTDSGLATAMDVLRMTLSNRILWILAVGYFCMNSVRYAFMNWAVTYMADFHGRSIKGSAFTAVALPLIGAIGAVSAGWFSDRLFGRRRAPVCAISLFLLAGVCIGFIMVPRGEWVVATAMLGLAGFLIYGPDMLMSGAATADVHPRATAAATGFTMCMGATGSILSGAGVGWLKDVTPGMVEDLRTIVPSWAADSMSEWTLIFAILAALSVVSALLMVSIWNSRPKTA